VEYLAEPAVMRTSDRQKWPFLGTANLIRG
jgi:hypothetical protein